MMTSVSENDAKEGRVTDEQGVTDGITIVCEHDRRESEGRNRIVPQITRATISERWSLRAARDRSCGQS